MISIREITKCIMPSKIRVEVLVLCFIFVPSFMTIP